MQTLMRAEEKLALVITTNLSDDEENLKEFASELVRAQDYR